MAYVQVKTEMQSNNFKRFIRKKNLQQRLQTHILRHDQIRRMQQNQIRLNIWGETYNLRADQINTIQKIEKNTTSMRSCC